jgi:hypothetical protein
LVCLLIHDVFNNSFVYLVFANICYALLDAQR